MATHRDDSPGSADPSFDTEVTGPINRLDIPVSDPAGGIDGPTLAAAFAGLPGRDRELLWQFDVLGAEPSLAGRGLHLRERGLILRRGRARRRLATGYLTLAVQDGTRQCSITARDLGAAIRRGPRRQARRLNAPRHVQHLAVCPRCATLDGDITQLLRGDALLDAQHLITVAPSADPVAAVLPASAPGRHTGAPYREAYLVGSSATAAGIAVVAAVGCVVLLTTPSGRHHVATPTGTAHGTRAPSRTTVAAFGSHPSGSATAHRTPGSHPTHAAAQTGSAPAARPGTHSGRTSSTGAQTHPPRSSASSAPSSTAAAKPTPTPRPTSPPPPSPSPTKLCLPGLPICLPNLPT